MRARQRQPEARGSRHGSRAGPDQRSTRRPGRLGDARGLSALGGVLLILVVSAAAGSWDVLTGPGLRTIFAAAFVLSCLAAAALVHKEDLRAAIVAPPLLYCLLIVLAGSAESAGGGGGPWLRRQGLELLTALVVNFPVLLAGTAAAALVSLVRTARRHRPRGRRVPHPTERPPQRATLRPLQHRPTPPAQPAAQYPPASPSPRRPTSRQAGPPPRRPTR